MHFVWFYMIFHYLTFLLESKTKSEVKSELILFLCLSTMLHHFGDGEKPLEQTIWQNRLVRWLQSLNPGWMPFWKIPVRQIQDTKLNTGII